MRGESVTGTDCLEKPPPYSFCLVPRQMQTGLNVGREAANAEKRKHNLPEAGRSVLLWRTSDDGAPVKAPRAHGLYVHSCIPSVGFARNPTKAHENLRNHGASFEEAEIVFSDDQSFFCDLDRLCIGRREYQGSNHSSMPSKVQQRTRCGAPFS